MTDCLTKVSISLLRRAGVVSLLNSCRVVHKQNVGAAGELGADCVDEMAEKVAEQGVPLGSNTADCSFSLEGTGGNFAKVRAPIDGT
eukprot:308708-Pleurochrysis_carterae.AAC.1